MATIAPGTEVVLRAGEAAKLRFPPPESVRLYVAVHEGALKAGEGNRLTQVVGCVEDELHWVGALGDGGAVSGRAAGRAPERCAREPEVVGASG
jgi:hypothetical protein